MAHAFILSMIQEGHAKHYQISRHGEDAFFSIGTARGSLLRVVQIIVSCCLISQQRMASSFMALTR